MQQDTRPWADMSVGIWAQRLVGEFMRASLAERNSPLVLSACSPPSARGQVAVMAGTSIVVEDAATADYSGLDVVFFSRERRRPGDWRRWPPPRCDRVDNSSAWRWILTCRSSSPRSPVGAQRHAQRDCSRTRTARPWRRCRPQPLHAAAGLRRLICEHVPAVSGGGLAACGSWNLKCARPGRLDDPRARWRRRGLPAADEVARSIAFKSFR